MKNPILLLLAIFSIMPSFSTERDTTVIFNQKEILIKDSSEIVSVTVYENGNKYNKYYESRHIDGKKTNLLGTFRIRIVSLFRSNFREKER